MTGRLFSKFGSKKDRAAGPYCSRCLFRSANRDRFMENSIMLSTVYKALTNINYIMPSDQRHYD